MKERHFRQIKNENLCQSTPVKEFQAEGDSCRRKGTWEVSCELCAPLRASVFSEALQTPEAHRVVVSKGKAQCLTHASEGRSRCDLRK